MHFFSFLLDKSIHLWVPTTSCLLNNLLKLFKFLLFPALLPLSLLSITKVINYGYLNQCSTNPSHLFLIALHNFYFLLSFPRPIHLLHYTHIFSKHLIVAPNLKCLGFSYKIQIVEHCWSTWYCWPGWKVWPRIKGTGGLHQLLTDDN